MQKIIKERGDFAFRNIETVAVIDANHGLTAAEFCMNTQCWGVAVCHSATALACAVFADFLDFVLMASWLVLVFVLDCRKLVRALMSATAFSYRGLLIVDEHICDIAEVDNPERLASSTCDISPVLTALSTSVSVIFFHLSEWLR